MKKPRWINITDLPFISILDNRPKAEQFVLIAWEMNGYCGYESIYWDNKDFRCKHAVAWCNLEFNHVFTRKCAVALKKKERLRPVILRWSKHFAHYKDGKYLSTDKLPKVAERLSTNGI